MAALAVVGALVGCGVPVEDTPHVLPTANVPFDLLAPRATTAPGATGTRTARIYLVRGDAIAPTLRRSATELTPERVMNALMEGPVGEEPARGLRTAIPVDTEVLGVVQEGELLTVDLSTDFTSVGSEQQILAIAQIVYSLTELPGVGGVRFLIEGAPVQVPREDGSLTAAPLTRADYDGSARA